MNLILDVGETFWTSLYIYWYPCPKYARIHVNKGQANSWGESPALLRKSYGIIYNWLKVVVNGSPTIHDWKSLSNKMLVIFVSLWAIARQFSCTFANEVTTNFIRNKRCIHMYIWGWKMHLYYSHLLPFPNNFFWRLSCSCFVLWCTLACTKGGI